MVKRIGLLVDLVKANGSVQSAFKRTDESASTTGGLRHARQRRLMTLVMLIDDDPLLGDVVSASLSQAGYTVGVLTDGRGAVAIIEFKRPAIVLLDCAMPVIPGIEVLRGIRSSRISFAVPVLMLTARDRSSDRDIAMRAGATSYMCKPFDADRLVMTVDQMISDDQHKHARFAVNR